jgi:hypothetical protein
LVFAPAGGLPYNALSSHSDVQPLRGGQESAMALVCPTCGNAQVFLVKTTQAHVVRLHAARVDVLEETRPSVSEVLCGECDDELDLVHCDDATRRELLVTLGAQ